jgi:glycosyltransferase involved in cell wall biosynthesis
MISIVICSRTKLISNGLFNNIRQTIGLEYELIVIDNSDNKYSIFQAYNTGIINSKGNIVCFIHDDIQLITQDWGHVLLEIFDKNKDVGLIGVAGAKSKTKMPSAWWDCPKEDHCININQYLHNGKKEFWRKGFEKSSLEEVVAIDGVFMAARKDTSILFNTKLTGFHNYDLNFSFEYLKRGYRIVATKDILLDHFSIGVLDKSWYKSSLIIYKLYSNILPLTKSDFVPIKNYEFSNGSKFIENLLRNKLKGPAFYLWLKLFLIKPASKFHFYFFKSLFR